MTVSGMTHAVVKMRSPRCWRMLDALLLAVVIAAAPSVLTSRVVAQDYPAQPIKIVVPFVAGGGVDVVARIIAPKLSELLGQPVLIENRGGAGGMLGAQMVAQSPSDGYTVLFGTGSTHGANSNVYRKISYDPVKDFSPIVVVANTPLLLVTNPSYGINSTKDLVERAHKEPGKMVFGSYGTGGNNHLAAELFNHMAGIEANHVPYRGSAPELTDLIGGRLSYVFDGISTTLGYSQAGTLKVLATGAPTRTSLLPGVPTVAETVPGFDAVSWFALFAPAGTAQGRIDLINRKVNALLGDPQVKEAFVKLGIEAVGGAPSVVAGNVQTELKKWAEIVRIKDIHVD